MHHVVADDHVAGLQVEVLPPQGADLARPKRSGRLQPQEQLQLRVLLPRPPRAPVVPGPWSALARVALCGAGGLTRDAAF